MSLGHVRLLRLFDTKFAAEYLVESFDFEKNRDWEEIGRLQINKTALSYSFEPEAVWSREKILPPEIYSLEEEQRKTLLESSYKEFGWGIISQRVHFWAIAFINTHNFPLRHPEIHTLGLGILGNFKAATPRQ